MEKEELFNKVANRMMHQWDINKFKVSHKRLFDVIMESMDEYAGLKNNGALGGVSSCYAVFDEEDNIVQLYQTEEKANKGLWEFQNSHPHTEFYIDIMQIN